MSLEVEGKNESVVQLSFSFLAGGGISIKMLHDHLTLFSPLVFFFPQCQLYRLSLSDYEIHVWDFLGGPVVKMPHFQCR